MIDAMSADSLPMTAEGYATRSHELAVLRTDRRRELGDRVREARLDGDVHGNPVLQDLLDEQMRLERRIALLEASLAVAEVVEPVSGARAEIGSVVRVRDAQGATYEYELVGPLESDVGNGRVSIAAPVGRALVERAVGEIVEVVTPRGATSLEIVSVRPARMQLRAVA